MTIRQKRLLAHNDPKAPISEAFRVLRTNIQFASVDKPLRTLAVTSAGAGSGKSTTVANLGVAIAQSGSKVILIDADMRRPSLHQFFGVSNDTGLSTLLQGQSRLTEVFRKTEVDNLIVIPGGPQPMNPSELLGSDRMREIVDMLQEHCDLVLFDSPSTIVFSDGPMLASWVDAVVMVVSANQAPRGTEVQTRDLLRKAKANILGVIVNRMQPDMVDSCYYYSHYYSDSALKPAEVSAMSPGNGRGAKVGHGHAEPKAIPAPAAAEQEAAEPVDEENPFPT